MRIVFTSLLLCVAVALEEQEVRAVEISAHADLQEGASVPVKMIRSEQKGLAAVEMMPPGPKGSRRRPGKERRNRAVASSAGDEAEEEPSCEDLVCVVPVVVPGSRLCSLFNACMRPCGACGPIDCQYTDWSQWGECDASCSGGSHMRSRSVTRSAANGGKQCVGPREGTGNCNDDVPCPTPAPPELSNVSNAESKEEELKKEEAAKEAPVKETQQSYKTIMSVVGLCSICLLLGFGCFAVQPPRQHAGARQYDEDAGDHEDFDCVYDDTDDR